jgi:ABC-type transporter Mla subunit MlaD
MQKPAYKVKVGSEAFDSSTSSEILSINIDCDINIPLDIFRITFKPGGKGDSIKKGDEAAIELGYEGSTAKVFTGTVDSVEPRAGGAVVTGYSVASALTRLKVHQVYEKQSAGAIVKDLAQQAGAKAKDPEEGISFPMYVVDDSKSAYEHMRELAGLCGFDLFMLPDGQVSFKKYAPKKARPFKYGRDILLSVVQELSPQVTSVKVFEESPSSSKGADTAHWLTKNVMGGASGGGDQAYIIRHPAIRDKDTADKVAAAKLESLLVSLKGSIKAIGSPKVGLGDTIELKEMPDERMNGEFEVVRASHAFNVEQGYVSTFGWIKKVTISPGEPPMVEPPSVPAPPKEPGFLEEQLQKAQEAMEDARQRLMDAVESAEESLEGLLEEVNKALAEVDKMAAEAIAAAGEAKKAAEAAANEGLKYADKLKKELEDQKKKLNEAIDEAEKKYKEAKDKAEGAAKKLEDEASKLKEKAESLKKEAEDKVKELSDEAEAELKKLDKEVDGVRAKVKEWEDKASAYEAQVTSMKADAGGKGVDLEDKIKELENKAKEAKDKAQELQKEIEDKTKAITDKRDEIKKKADELKKEYEDKVKEVEGKVKEAEDKYKEEKKKVEDTLKEAEDKVKECRKKLDDTVKELEGKIDEATGTAKKLMEEADEKYEQAVKKAEEGRKEAAKAVESLKKAYKEARDTVMSARQTAGLD